MNADGAVGSAIVICLARFHFNEYQAIILPTDEVDFAGAGSHAIVAGDDDDPVALQVTVRDVLTTAA